MADDQIIGALIGDDDEELQRQRSLEINAGIARQQNPAGEAEIEARTGQQSFIQNVVDGFNSNTAGRALQRISDEADVLQRDIRENSGISSALAAPVAIIGAAFGFNGGEANYNRSEKYTELTTGIPYEYHESILAEQNYEAALRARARVQGELERGKRMARQKGATSVLGMMTGSMLDVDLPLIAFSGGSLGAAKLARGAHRTAKAVGLGESTATRLASTAVGVSGGLQGAGIAVAVDMAGSETFQWEDAADMFLTSALAGGAFGAALTGDAARMVQNTQKELYRNVARDHKIDIDPDSKVNMNSLDLDDPADVPQSDPAFMDNNMTADAAASAADRESIGAQRVANTTVLPKDPLMRTGPDESRIIQQSQDWWTRSGADYEYQETAETLWGKIMLGTFENDLSNKISAPLRAFGNDFIKLHRSASPVAKHMTHAIFENGATLGRGTVTDTAATMQNVYQARMAAPIMKEFGSALNNYAKTHNSTFAVMGKRTGVGADQAITQQFYREVRMALNDQIMGRTPKTTDPDVINIVNRWNTAMERAVEVYVGRNGEKSVAGAENLVKREGYVPQRVNGAMLSNLITSGRANRKVIEQAFAQSYVAAGLPPDVANKISKAVVTRAIARDNDLDTSLVGLLTEDGREFLRMRLESTQVPQSEVEAIMRGLTGMAEERSRSPNLKHRNDLDLDTDIRLADGTSIKLVDLMQNDLPSILQHYQRGVAGAGALARKGIRSRKDRDIYISAIQSDMRARGEEPPTTDMLKAVFSEFDGGPQWGYAAGMTNKGVGHHIQLGKTLTRLSLLSSMGFSQLAEHGTQIASQGLGNWFRQNQRLMSFDKAIKAQDQAVLDDIVYMAGEIHQDQHFLMPHRNMDEVTADEAAEWLQTANRWANNASYLQSYTSLFNTVRDYQQRSAALGITNKVFMTLRKGPDASEYRRLKYDFGMDDQMIDDLTDLINNGTIEFDTLGKTGFVNRLHPDKWDAKLQDKFAAVMMRAQSQQVQKSLAGETDRWMHTQWGSVLTQLRTFPMASIQKQFMRNARFMDKEALGTVSYGIASAYIAMSLRDTLLGNERSATERGKAAITYSSALGWIPMGVDPIATIVGLDDMRFEQYGARYEFQLPALDVANKLMFQTPVGAFKYLTGQEMDSGDKQGLLALPFARTLGLKSLLDWTSDRG